MKLKYQNPTKWHEWFAWHPVVVDGGMVWMERVERMLYAADVFCEVWHYRKIKNEY